MSFHFFVADVEEFYQQCDPGEGYFALHLELFIKWIQVLYI